MSIRKLILGEEFKTGWNPDKYIIFVNRRLLNKSMYEMVIPSDENYYADKIIYFYRDIEDGSKIDVYYIESDENFDTVPFNEDVKIESRIIYATEDNQESVMVPYPYDTYPRNDHCFEVFADDGRYLDHIKDYASSYDKEYIRLMDDTILKEKGINYLIFTFPYVHAGWEIEGEDQYSEKNDSGVNFRYSYSDKIKPDGIVTFEPVFQKFTLSKKDFILFGNTTYIDPSRYDIIDNGTLQFKDEVDKQHSTTAKYTMIVTDEKVRRYSNRKYAFSVFRLDAEEDKQFAFQLPNEAVDNNFVLFKGTTSLDELNRYRIDKTNNIITIQNEEDYVPKGRSIICVVYKLSVPLNDDKLVFEKIKYKNLTKDSIKITDYRALHKNLTKDRILLFVNGLYVDPFKYVFLNNTITIKDTSYGLDTANKAVTLMYLSKVPNMDNTESNPAMMNKLLKDDNDFIWFDEMHAWTYAQPKYKLNRDIVSMINIM